MIIKCYIKLSYIKLNIYIINNENEVLLYMLNLFDVVYYSFCEEVLEIGNIWNDCINIGMILKFGY